MKYIHVKTVTTNQVIWSIAFAPPFSISSARKNLLQLNFTCCLRILISIKTQTWVIIRLLIAFKFIFCKNSFCTEMLPVILLITIVTSTHSPTEISSSSKLCNSIFVRKPPSFFVLLKAPKLSVLESDAEAGARRCPVFSLNESHMYPAPVNWFYPCRHSKFTDHGYRCPEEKSTTYSPKSLSSKQIIKVLEPLRQSLRVSILTAFSLAPIAERKYIANKKNENLFLIITNF